MSVEEIKTCTMENAWELVEFAEAQGIQIQGQDVADLYDHIYDLKNDVDNDSIAEIIGDILKCSKSKRVYDYLSFGGVLSVDSTPMSKQDTVAPGLRVHLHQQGFA